MNFTTNEFYIDSYLMGRVAVLDTATFPFYATKATQTIKHYTFDNIPLNEPINDLVQMCTCELAEFLFNDEEQSKNRAIGVISERVAEYTLNFETSKNIADYKENVIKGIIYNWLATTGYLYRGV